MYEHEQKKEAIKSKQCNAKLPTDLLISKPSHMHPLHQRPFRPGSALFPVSHRPRVQGPGVILHLNTVTQLVGAGHVRACSDLTGVACSDGRHATWLAVDRSRVAGILIISDYFLLTKDLLIF